MYNVKNHKNTKSFWNPFGDSDSPTPNSKSSVIDEGKKGSEENNSVNSLNTYYSTNQNYGDDILIGKNNNQNGGNTPANKSKQTKTNTSQTYIEKKLILLHYIITDKFGQLNIDETDEDQSMRIQLQNNIYKKLDDQNIANEKLIENGRKLFNRNINRKLLKEYLTNDKFDKYLDYIEYHI